MIYNDLWNFNFNLKKWKEISSAGKTLCPKARDCHNTAIIFNRFMSLYAGLDDKDNFIKEIYLYKSKKKIGMNVI